MVKTIHCEIEYLRIFKNIQYPAGFPFCVPVADIADIDFLSGVSQGNPVAIAIQQFRKCKLFVHPNCVIPVVASHRTGFVLSLGF
jgi:uncharacterized protein (DUF779 family)